MMNQKKLKQCMILVISASLLGGCVGRPSKDAGPWFDKDVSRIKNAVPKKEAPAVTGNRPKYQVFGKDYKVLETSKGYQAKGFASWYGRKFHGQKTSSGEPYDMFAMTAAHKHLPIPSYVKVENLENNTSIIVKVNDRGPFHDDRIIDLSYAAAKKLGFNGRGTAYVKVIALPPFQARDTSLLHLAESYEGDTGDYYTEQQNNSAPTVSASGASRTQQNAANSGTPYIAASPQTKQVYLQIGAFSDKHLAQRLLAQTEHISQGVVKMSDTAKRTLYKVRLGPFESQDKARMVEQKLLASQVASPILIWE